MGTTLIIIALVVVIAFIAFAFLPQKHRTATAAYSRKPLRENSVNLTIQKLPRDARS